jgi:hypothetical protein
MTRDRILDAAAILVTLFFATLCAWLLIAIGEAVTT